MKRTIFNNYYVRKPIVKKKWYGVIDVEDKSYFVECPFETKIRSEAVGWLEGQARKNDGVLSIVNVLE